jgi:hypothetical protein
MLVPDELVWIGMLILCIYFTESAFTNRISVSGDRFSPGFILAMVRPCLMFFLSGVSWIVLGIMLGSVNNCSEEFQACYTSPTYATTTSDIFPAHSAGALLYFAWGVGFVMILIGAVMVIYIALYMPASPEGQKGLGPNMRGGDGGGGGLGR